MPQIRSTPSYSCLALLLPALLAISACEGGGPTTGPDPDDNTVTGTVTNSATGSPISGAEVSIGDLTTTTGADGRFELTVSTAGPATLRCVATGFEDFETAITLPAAGVSRNIELTRVELFEFGDFAIYVPATVPTVRGVLISLGGPDTRGFASGGPFGAPVPEAEAALGALGQELRALAASHGLAVLGTSRASIEEGPETDQVLLATLQESAARSGRPEIASAPLLFYGISGGGPEAAGFTARNPDRVAGLFLKVPESVAAMGGAALGVPTYVVLAELDAFIDNAGIIAAFEANRAAGAIWALALERGVPHHSLSPAHRGVTAHWMDAVLDLRLPVTPSDPMPAIAEPSGWLGDGATGTAPWDAFTGDRSSASWFPNQSIAEEWKEFVGI